MGPVNTSAKMPRIGITCESETVIDRRGAPLSRYTLAQTYVDAVIASGGEPWLLPSLEPEQADSIFDVVQGLVIAGGDFDIPPTYYGQEPKVGLGRLCEKRSAFEKALVNAARTRQVPILGLCGGMQLINVVYGGTLFQDLSLRSGTFGHQQVFDKRQTSHPVQVVSGTRLAELTKAVTLGVNSTHHQIVDKVGAGLVVCGTAPDGVIEAIEAQGASFVMGVQWHPEALGDFRMYRGLVAACA